MTIPLTDEQFSKLKEKAKALGITPEDLVKIEIEDFISTPNEEFKNTMNYVLKKNHELYKRLAK